MTIFLYVVLRTYPFWAVPLAVMLLTVSFSKQRQQPLNKSTKHAYIALSVTLIVTSGLYLFLGGPMHAIPMMHEALHKGLPPLPGSVEAERARMPASAER